MGKTREIKKRIKAVGNIRRITKTMQMIATSKFARAQQSAMASKPYTTTLFDLVNELAAGLGDVTHPLLAGSTQTKRVGKELTLVLTSERGLCGPYNGSVLRAAAQLFRGNPDAKGLVEVVGKKGAGFFRYSGVQVSKAHNFGDKVSYDSARKLAEDYTARFLAGEISTVRVVYMKYLSAGRQTPTVMQLIPFQPPPAKKGDTSGPAKIYEFSPDAPALLGDLLPAAVKGLLFQAFNDAIVSEHVARMVAMKSATDNAGKAGKRLTRQYNRARQAQITTELTEIISGAAALA
ncbi:F-type H+-transporting ATPase subunit gamma [Phycisphaerales bacterium]|nr:F-type H+-transporting ATPase subunit gamma [Phycisphaerales bacterium]